VVDALKAAWRTVVKRLRLVIALLVLVLVPKPASAQVVEGRRAVVLLDSSLPSSQAATRLEALRVHLTDVSARVLVERLGALSTTQQRVRAAVALGRRAGAAVVLFVEEMGDAELRVYWVEPRAGRVWMRGLVIGSDGIDAASEKVAIIARGGVEELLQLGQLSMEPVSVAAVEKRPPKAPVRLQPKPPAARGFRLALGAAYEGTSFSPEASWQHGAQLSLSVRLLSGFYVSAKHSFMGPLDISHAGGAAELVRRPSELGFGYRARHRFAWRGELGAFADWVERSTTAAASDQRPTADDARVLLGASAKMGLDLRLLERVRLVGLFGLQAIFNHFDYLNDDVRREVAIHIRPFRPQAEVGVVAELW
jgi:hypothetical protein